MESLSGFQQEIEQHCFVTQFAYSYYVRYATTYKCTKQKQLLADCVHSTYRSFTMLLA